MAKKVAARAKRGAVANEGESARGGGGRGNSDRARDAVSPGPDGDRAAANPDPGTDQADPPKASAKSRPGKKKKATAARARPAKRSAKKAASKKTASKKKAAAKKQTARKPSKPAAKKKAAAKKATTKKRPEEQRKRNNAKRRVAEDSRLADQSIAQLQQRAQAGDKAAIAELTARRSAIDKAASGGDAAADGIDPETQQPESNIVTFQFFADAIGVGSTRTIQRLSNDGAIVRHPSRAGRLLFGQSMASLIKYLMQGGPPHKRATEDARRRKIENDAIIQEMKIAEKAAELMDRTEVDHLVGELLVTARRGFENQAAANHSASSLNDARNKGDKLVAENLAALDDVLVAVAGEPEDDDGFGDSAD